MKKNHIYLFIFLLFSLINISSANAQIFYKISGNGLEKPSYIIGTHHLAPVAVLDSLSSFNEAFESVQQVVGEIDMTLDQMTMSMAMQPYMMAPSDSTLTKLIDHETFGRINKQFTEETGYPLQMFDAMRPMVPMTLYSVSVMSKLMPGFNPQEQIDSYLQFEAKDRALTVAPLETIEQQAKLLYTEISLDNQAEELVKSIEEPEKLVETAKELTDAYLEGNLDALYQISLEDNSQPEFFEKLTKQRNDAWLEQLPAMMTDKPSMIAVGALHLCGDDGLLSQLKKAGYTVEPLK